jgi:hypothetical protein
VQPSPLPWLRPTIQGIHRLLFQALPPLQEYLLLSFVRAQHLQLPFPDRHQTRHSL